MVVLTWVGCILFLPPASDPRERAPLDTSTPTPEPVPRDTGGGGPVDRSTLTGSWAGRCTLDGGYSGPFPVGDSGVPGDPEQFVQITMDLVEVTSGQIFGGATLELVVGGRTDYAFGAGVTGSREDSDVQFSFVVGAFPLGSLDATWDRQEDTLVGTLDFDGYGARGTCRLER